MMRLRIGPMALALTLQTAGYVASAAEMSVGQVVVRPGDTVDVVVSGSIDGASTFAWTIMLELVPHDNVRGTVTFTASGSDVTGRTPAIMSVKTPENVDAVYVEQPHRPDVDIHRQVDVWPDGGTFTAYDTYQTGSSNMNGAVDDNGTFVPAPITFSGALAGFPVVASPNAQGVWDVLLTTTAGSSNWEGIKTTLVAGTITVGNRVCRGTRECDDRDPCTIDACSAGQCVHRLKEGACGNVEATRLKNRRQK